MAIPGASPVRDLLNKTSPYDKGGDPGSRWYMRSSPKQMLRTKALQTHSTLIYPKGDAIVPINPRVFQDLGLKEGDILLSKDSNVGEVAIVDAANWRDHSLSGGLVRLNVDNDPYYLFAFLKHEIFREQLSVSVPRGATIKHANELWLDCLIPFPQQENAEIITRYVSSLMRAIIDKEVAIRQRSEAIDGEISSELMRGQKPTPFVHTMPSVAEIRAVGRFDAAIYDQEYRSKIWLVENYSGGFSTPKTEGFVVTPGPSLEIKILKTRLDSSTPKKGFYTLLLPMNISVYGTMSVLTYLGTSKPLPNLRQGDVLFGEAGFQKGRSIVLVEGIDNCTTNAHGLYARRKDGDLTKSIFFRCVFNWYRSQRLIDLMAVGGSGGHFSPEYFELIRIPSFPQALQEKIAKLYHSDCPPPAETPTLDTFRDWHKRWNDCLGIWELDRELKNLWRDLRATQEEILGGRVAEVPPWATS